MNSTLLTMGRGKPMVEKGTLHYKLTKITIKTVLAGAVGLIMFLLAKDQQFDPVWSVAGAFFLILGESLRLWAAGHLRKNKQLTTTGPYSYVKNPLYIGTLLISIGFSIMAKNLWILVISVTWFFIYYAPYKKKQENEKLLANFHDAWTAYDKAVPDYLPLHRPYPGRGVSSWSYSVVKENSEHETALGVFVGFCAMLVVMLL